jgi:hypothetical protein
LSDDRNRKPNTHNHEDYCEGINGLEHDCSVSNTIRVEIKEASVNLKMSAQDGGEKDSTDPLFFWSQ